jgi:hypothetical protein
MQTHSNHNLPIYTATPLSPLQPHYCPWGHDFQAPKPNNTTRLYYKNTNSIGTRAFTNGLTTLYQHHKELAIDIALYTETNTNNNQPQKALMTRMAATYTTTPYSHTPQGRPQPNSGTIQAAQ